MPAQCNKLTVDVHLLQPLSVNFFSLLAVFPGLYGLHCCESESMEICTIQIGFVGQVWGSIAI